MTAGKLAWPVVCLLSGLGIGALWSPLSGVWQIPAERKDMPGSRAVSDAQISQHIAEVRQQVGEEAAKFEEQFKDMTIRINESPVRVSASPDGRFVIRNFESGEIIASDLFYPDKDGTMNELVRHYSFSRDKDTYSCDFGRSVKDPKITEVQFRFADAKGGELSYVDSDGDGRWDRLTDCTQMPPQSYVRDGLCWKIVTGEN